MTLSLRTATARDPEPRRINIGDVEEAPRLNRQPRLQPVQSHGVRPVADGQVSHAGLTSVRVLFVDDEPDLRTVVGFSLALDPQITVRTCASGQEALAVAAEWSPDLILCDVMMPVMDGPATLARLRENPRTARIPVVFMTARARVHEREYLSSLGACGVIAKPFEPTTLAQSVRSYLPPVDPAMAGAGCAAGRQDAAGLATETVAFERRLRADAVTLVKCRARLQSEGASSVLLEQLGTCAHKLAGAAGLYDFDRVSRSASALEEAIVDRRSGSDIPGDIEAALDALIGWMEDSVPGARATDAAEDLVSPHRLSV